ncbi:MAG: hypothetical protein EHM42_01085, partial [Planctomycetaceae bacterium]
MVEIDLLRTGQCVFAAPENRIPSEMIIDCYRDGRHVDFDDSVDPTPRLNEDDAQLAAALRR